eukprot:GHVT01024629.1.p1 GENE.GHVT01024629.1~~GHVT01024629.1.p1  ORF type:complete len:571 (+),score=46.65 GHVT01024629.1:146-1858(+)
MAGTRLYRRPMVWAGLLALLAALKGLPVEVTAREATSSGTDLGRRLMPKSGQPCDPSFPEKYWKLQVEGVLRQTLEGKNSDFNITWKLEKFELSQEQNLLGRIPIRLTRFIYPEDSEAVETPSHYIFRPELAAYFFRHSHVESLTADALHTALEMIQKLDLLQTKTPSFEWQLHLTELGQLDFKCKKEGERYYYISPAMMEHLLNTNKEDLELAHLDFNPGVLPPPNDSANGASPLDSSQSYKKVEFQKLSSALVAYRNDKVFFIVYKPSGTICYRTPEISPERMNFTQTYKLEFIKRHLNLLKNLNAGLEGVHLKLGEGEDATIFFTHSSWWDPNGDIKFIDLKELNDPNKMEMIQTKIELASLKPYRGFFRHRFDEGKLITSFSLNRKDQFGFRFSLECNSESTRNELKKQLEARLEMEKVLLRQACGPKRIWGQITLEIDLAKVLTSDKYIKILDQSGKPLQTLTIRETAQLSNMLAFNYDETVQYFALSQAPEMISNAEGNDGKYTYHPRAQVSGIKDNTLSYSFYVEVHSKNPLPFKGIKLYSKPNIKNLYRHNLEKKFEVADQG